MSKRLGGKVAIITGATAGIGEASAKLFAEEGAKVVAAGRRADLGRKVVAEIADAGGEAIFIEADVSKFADHCRLVDAALETWGRLDVAFNNAGTAHPHADIQDFDENVWNWVVQVNLTGVFLAMKAQIPALLKSGGGSIINTSSVGGLIAAPGGSAYQSAKHGVIGVTKVAALELATKNIRVNALCPGGTLTDMFRSWIETDDEVRKEVLADHPIGRFAEPIEQARAALFLASDDSSYITGVALPVDGGLVVP
jgi:NAD(P)-dependent dehydrogenase (short-subunit alcohol dehydrogenase family)